jgi:AcrR family transcriptional regulator
MKSKTKAPEASTRVRILDAAAEAFADKGYHGTGMSEIGDRADIQRGALYYHIGSKEELLYDLCRYHVEEALSEGRAAVSHSDDAREQFRALVHSHLLTLVERRSFVVIAEREMQALTGERAAALVTLRREYQDLFGQVMRLGVEQRHFSRSEQLEVMGVLGMLNYTYMWLNPDGPAPISEVADRLCNLLLEGLAVR